MRSALWYSSLVYLHSTMFIFILEKGVKKMYEYKFTFHYVYIYMKKVLWQWPRHWDLHSTMFIFISNKVKNIISNARTFTFHYVYIYIWLQSFFVLLHLHLHSTMFIFICKSCDWYNYWYCDIYIPLCLYLYFILQQRNTSTG